MKKIKLNASNICVCLFEVIVGILVLIDPVSFTTGIIIAAGIALMITGLSSVIKYFRMDVEDAAASQHLLNGLILLVLGAFCAFKSYWFITTFPLLTMVYGVVILVAGLGKVQWAVDMIRMKKDKWFLPAISAVVSILCAAIILKNPFSSTVVLWIFTGISLIVEAMFDLVTLAVGGRNREKKEEKKEEQAADDNAVSEPVVSEEKAEEI